MTRIVPVSPSSRRFFLICSLRVDRQTHRWTQSPSTSVPRECAEQARRIRSGSAAPPVSPCRRRYLLGSG